jgi:hypothetical protein
MVDLTFVIIVWWLKLCVIGLAIGLIIAACTGSIYKIFNFLSECKAGWKTKDQDAL